MKPLRIAITGARGFVGSHLTRQFRDSGNTVVGLSRQRPLGESDWLCYSLDATPPGDSLQGFDVLIHCAYDFQCAGPEEDRRRNVDGSIELFKAAQQAGVRHRVFISTLSAFTNCRSRYGQGKLAVEHAVAQLGGFSLRLGFVYDGSGRGLSGALSKLVRTWPVVPLPGTGNQTLYPLAAADLGPSILRIIEQRRSGGVFALAQEEPMSLRALLRAFATEAGRSVAFLPVPWQAMWFGLRVLELVGSRSSFRSDSLVSLLNQNPDPDFAATRELGLQFRPFRTAMSSLRPVRVKQIEEDVKET